jgi:predicted regulator of Ras-like GTPase activity (Roadblock/LC7/MglB family)
MAEDEGDALGALEAALDQYEPAAPLPPGQQFFDVDAANGGEDGYAPPGEGGYAPPPGEDGYGPPGEDGYGPPGEDGYGPPPGEDGYADAPPAAERAYDFPGDPDLGRSYGSQAGGFGAASTSSLPEDIDVNTNGLIDETMQKLTHVPGVYAVLLIDKEGRIVHATMPAEEAAQLTAPTLQMLRSGRIAVEASSPGDELQMLCVRTRMYEMLLCGEVSGAFAVCVLQDPQPQQLEASLASDVANGTKSIKRGLTAAAPGVLF